MLHTRRKNKSKIKIGRYLLLFIVVGVSFFYILQGKITPPTTVTVTKGDTFQKFIKPLSFLDRLSVKYYIETRGVDNNNLEIGTYMFSGEYSPAEYLSIIMAGPTEEYVRYTMLEGRSIYDIDRDMTDKGLITSGAFVFAAKDSSTIKKFATTYPFLADEPQLTTLEGFLYPDTYFLASDGDKVAQLMQASLKRFNEKIYALWEKQHMSFITRLQPYGVVLSFPGSVALASVIEKEERNNNEKPTIASIFLNRLSDNIPLGADITLCYGRQLPYETCKPSTIVQYINDRDNVYNTRVHTGLPPTPISSITEATFSSLLHFIVTDYIFYLHDARGDIHYAVTNEEHEKNKIEYLQ